MDSYIDAEVDAVDLGHITVPPFGISMDGNQTCMLRAAKIAIDTLSKGDDFIYVEFGIARGDTLNAMGKSILQLGVLKERLYVVGVDIENGWSLDREWLGGYSKTWTFRHEFSFLGSVPWMKLYKGKIDYLLIDGCHEKTCAMEDFTTAEPLVRVGGVIAFHDSDDISQSIQPQPHRGEPIAVRDAMRELGLLDNARPGWKKLADIEALPGNHGVAIFKKVA
jgi:hypothetical protein